MRIVHRLLACVFVLSAPSTAWAVPVIVAVNADTTTTPFSFNLGGAVFTFAATGDFFNPLSVRNSTPAAVNSFGGFLGIPVSPTTNFIDRGVVTFGPGDPFTSFPTATTVPFSNGNNFIGLRATIGADSFFGFAFTTNALVNSVGFETAANTEITATTAIPAASAVPEMGTWATMLIGFGLLGGGARYRRRRVRLAFTPAG